MADLKPAHILLADDDDEDQELFKESLAQQIPALVLTTVWNGQELLSFLENCPDTDLPWAIVLDYKMPILNGAEVLDRLATQPRYAAIPKMVWSTSSQHEYIDECLKKGAVRFFIKPNSSAELHDITRQVLSLCRQPR